MILPNPALYDDWRSYAEALRRALSTESVDNISAGAVNNLAIGNVIQSIDFDEVNKKGWRIRKDGVIEGQGLALYDENGNLIVGIGGGVDWAAVVNKDALSKSAALQLQGVANDAALAALLRAREAEQNISTSVKSAIRQLILLDQNTSQRIAGFNEEIVLLADKVGNALATVTWSVDAGGVITGIRITSATGESTISNVLVMAAELQLAPGGIIVWRSETMMRVLGLGFGVNSQFISWFGPRLATIDLCDIGNAVSYETVNGAAKYPSGTVSAPRSVSSSSLGPVSISIAPFAPTGSTRSVSVTLSRARFGQRESAWAATGPAGQATVNLYRKIGAAPEVLVASQVFNETVTPISGSGIPSEPDSWSSDLEGSLVFVDNDPSTANREFRAQITSITSQNISGTAFGVDSSTQLLALSVIE